MLLENYQVIKEGGSDRFAIIDMKEFQEVKDLLNNTEKLQDYLDYLHLLSVKNKKEKMYSLDEAKRIFDL